MRYGVVFLILGALLLVMALVSESLLVRVITGYTAVSCLALGVGYLLRRPGILMKRASGDFPALSYLLYAPYHTHNHVFLSAFRRLSKRPRWTEIVPGLFLGGRLRGGDRTHMAAAGKLSVLDVTGEFADVSWLRTQPSYLCIPLLDGTAPDQDELQRGIAFIRERLACGPVYVHCAFGHSRSATFVIGYLIASGQSPSLADALAFVQSKRPRVRLTSAQTRCLEQAFPAHA